MGMNLGLLEGVNEAIQSGLGAYKEERRYQDEKEERSKNRSLDLALKRLQAKQQGYDFDPTTGTATETQERLDQKERERRKYERENAEYDPMSEYSRTERERAKGLLKGSRYAGLISDSMTGRQVNDALNDANPFLQRESAERIARERNNKEFGNPNKMQFGHLPKESQEEITKIAGNNATARTIRNQLNADLELLDDPTINDEMKLVHARSMIKTLNSQQGQDAVGAEESKRLASLLEYHIMPNITQPGPMFGRAPISDFATQAKNSVKTLDAKIAANQRSIDDLYGRTGGARTGAGLDQAAISAYAKRYGLDEGTAAVVLMNRQNRGGGSHGVAGP